MRISETHPVAERQARAGSGTDLNEIVAARPWWTLVALLTAGFTLWTYGQVKVATAVIWEDTPGYLGHALYIAEHGGFWGFLREAYGGVFPITERHPLYLLMIAPFAARTPEFFWNAKLVNLATGVAILVSVLWMVERRYGRGPALIAGVLYSLSNSLLTASSHVDNEPVFVLCALWAWWFLTAVPRVATAEPAPDAEHDVARSSLKISDMPSSWTSWAIGGALVGLAYLAKSPAILIAVSVVAAATWHAGLRFLADRRFAAFVVSLLVVSSPLVVRNIIGFGTPLYEGINSHVMWLEDGSEFGDERSVLYEDQYGAMTIERNGLPTASDYFASHSITDVPRRLARGLYRELRTVVPDAIRSLLVPIGGRKISFLVFGLALVGWWFRRRSWDAALVFFWSGASHCVFFVGHLSRDALPRSSRPGLDRVRGTRDLGARRSSSLGEDPLAARIGRRARRYRGRDRFLRDERITGSARRRHARYARVFPFHRLAHGHDRARGSDRRGPNTRVLGSTLDGGPAAHDAVEPVGHDARRISTLSS